MSIEDKLLTVDEVLEETRISRGTLYTLWADDEGPRQTRIRGRVFVSRGDLSAWLEKQKSEVKAEQE